MPNRLTRLFLFTFLAIFGSIAAFSQEIPDSSTHLPQKIGGSKSGLNRVDSISVSGKVTFSGIPAGESPPVAYVAVFKYGRLVGRRQVSQSGSFTLNDVPRDGSTIVVEIDNVEVANSQIVPSPADVVYRDFSISWNQVPTKAPASGVISAKDMYARSKDNQDKFESAVEKLGGSKPEGAIAPLKLLVSSDPNDFPAWTELGNAYLMTGKTSDASKAFDSALTANPDYLAARLGKGRALVSEQSFEKAIEILSSAVAAAPTSADAHHFLGEAYLLAKKGSKAVPLLNEALRLAPIRKAEIHLQLAALYNGAGLKERAALEYKEFLLKVPKYEKRKELHKYIDANLTTK